MDDLFSGISLDVTTQEAIEGVREYALYLADHDEINDAFWFQRNLLLYTQQKAPRISIEHKEIATQLDREITRCQWVAFPFLPEKTIVELVERHLMVVFDWELVRLEDKIRQALIIEIDIDARDRKKKAMREALLRNEEQFTESTLVADGKAVQGTIREWIRDYLRAVGIKGGTTVAFAEYMTSALNPRKLPEHDRTRLKRLLAMFDELGKSSATVEGFEEVIPVDDPKGPGVIRAGVYEPVNPEAAKNIQDLRALRATTLGAAPVSEAGASIMTEVQKAGARVEQDVLANPETFVRALDAAVNQKDAAQVGTLLLAAKGVDELRSLPRVQELKKLVYYDLKTKKFNWK